MFPNEVVVAVADHGIGIPLGDFDQLFERYHRGSNVSGIVGTGVGLHLVKMVVDLHGGRVVVNSKEGEGSRFTIHLPIKDASAIKVWHPVETEPAGSAATVSAPAGESHNVLMSEQGEG
jgi:signal transduction histidine kinase